MPFSAEQKLRAAIEAPLGPGLARDDTRTIARPGWYQVVTPSAPGTSWNEIAYSQLDEIDAERAIDDAIATYHSLGKPVKWCVGPWTRPLDFAERLARRGFRSWAVSGMGIAADAPIPPSSGIRTREVATDADLVRYVDVFAEGWEVPSDQKDVDRRVLGRALEAAPRIVHLFVADDETTGECIGTAGLMLRSGYAYLLAAQVLERARGRGAYRALVAARLAFLRARGIEYAVTHARDATSAPILERLGFERVFRSSCWVLDPP